MENIAEKKHQISNTITLDIQYFTYSVYYGWIFWNNSIFSC